MDISLLINDFEKNNNYQLPTYLKEAAVFNKMIHLNQFNDIKNQEFNHICFIGDYNEIFSGKHDLLKNVNSVFRNLKNQVFLSKDLNKDTFKPTHTPYSFPCKFVNSFDEVLNGFIKHNQYYILINTEDNDIKFNVYTMNKNHCKDTNTDYLFFVLLGKIINPSPYTLEEINLFEQKYELKLNDEIKNYLTNTPKILTLTIEKAMKIFNINLNEPNLLISDLYSNLKNKFNKEIKESYDLEHFRKPLLKLWERSILNDDNDTTINDDLSIIRQNIQKEKENFLNGFLKIGTIENENYKNIGFDTNKNINLVVELYMLLNSEHNQGTLWIYQFGDSGTADISDIHYLPITRIFKIGSIFRA